MRKPPEKTFAAERYLAASVRAVTDIALELESGEHEIIQAGYGRDEEAIKNAVHDLDAALFEWAQWMGCDAPVVEVTDMKASLLARLDKNRDEARARWLERV
jgi:hypothetical protein